MVKHEVEMKPSTLSMLVLFVIKPTTAIHCPSFRTVIHKQIDATTPTSCSLITAHYHSHSEFFNLFTWLLYTPTLYYDSKTALDVKLKFTCCSQSQDKGRKSCILTQCSNSGIHFLTTLNQKKCYYILPSHENLFNIANPPWFLSTPIYLLMAFALPLIMRNLNPLVLLRHEARILRMLASEVVIDIYIYLYTGVTDIYLYTGVTS